MLAEPKTLLDVRQAKNETFNELEVLLKQNGLSLYEATWEDAPSIIARFPTFHLEDKLKLWGASNVTHKPLITYARQKQKDKKDIL